MDSRQHATSPGKPNPHPPVALGHLARLLSHDLCNPFNAIFLHTDLLEEDIQQLTPQAREPMLASLTEVKTEVARLQAMIEDYVMLARLGDLTCQPEALERLASACVMEMHALCEARDLTLQVEGLEDLGQVDLHRATLSHALANLLRQAIAATPPGGVVTLRGRRDGRRACLEVQDRGPGISQEALLLLCEPGKATHVDGPGLALYVAQAIAAAHGGQLTVQSTGGQGSTCSMSLPCSEGV